MKGLERRIAELERRMISGEIICYVANGTKRPLRGKRLNEMPLEISQGILQPDTQTIVDAVSDYCVEAGYGQIGDLLRLMWVGCQDLAKLDAPESSAPGGERIIGSRQFSIGGL